jgi:uncharacterized protein YeaO (DUF488 family)
MQNGWPIDIDRDDITTAVLVEEAPATLSPSDAMREEFHHATASSDAAWSAFREEYFAALGAGGEDVAAALAELDAAMKAGPVTLLYAAKDEERNNAVALREWLKAR